MAQTKSSLSISTHKMDAVSSLKSEIKDYKAMFNNLVDGICDNLGCTEACQLLLGSGFNKKDLEEMDFDSETIETAIFNNGGQ